MKEISIAVLAIAVLIFGLLFWIAASDRSNLRLDLAAEKAMAETSACGTQFVIAGLGVDKKEVAIAGRILSESDVQYFTQKDETLTNGNQVVATYYKSELLFTRPKK